MMVMTLIKDDWDFSSFEDNHIARHSSQPTLRASHNGYAGCFSLRGFNSVTSGGSAEQRFGNESC